MTAALVVSLLAVLVFGVGLWKGGVLNVAQASVGSAMSGVAAMTDNTLDDDSKELAVRRAAFALLRAAASIFFRFAVVLGAAAVPILLAEYLGIATAGSVISLMMRWDYVLVVSIMAIAIAEAARRFSKRSLRASATPATDVPATASVNSYSDMEQFLHGVAFSSPATQRKISRLEDFVIGRPRVEPAPPIFITSLARGGTTALLNALTSCPGIASHTYRDMPFLTAPVLWNRLAGGSKRKVTRRDRAHGDGLSIDLDTPEAFEEALWKMLWPEKYSRDGIALWTEADHDPDADRFISDQMAKIIRARFGQAPTQKVRYCSKNNANIGRLAYLQSAFPGCKTVVVLRQPSRHAASLHRQHLNFLALQESDRFIRKYMGDIGHLEFGQLFAPLAFPSFDPSKFDPEDPNHWLDYWISAFGVVWERVCSETSPILVTQDSLRSCPQETMEELACRLDIPLSTQNFERYFHSARDRGDDSIFCPVLLEKANDLYGKLAKHSL